MTIRDAKRKKWYQSKSSRKAKRLIYMFEDGKGIPVFLDLINYLDFAERIDETLKLVKRSKNPRLIALETWLIVDYSIRHLLRCGLEIDKFCDDDFDLLPDSFNHCLKSLQTFTKNQERKEPNPSKTAIRLPPEFVGIIRADKKFWLEYVKKEAEYYDKVGGFPSVVDPHDNRFRNVNEGWLRAVKTLNNRWFKKAERLNRVRNVAAHSFDETTIYKALGISGNDKLKKLKDHCTELLKDLMGIK